MRPIFASICAIWLTAMIMPRVCNISTPSPSMRDVSHEDIRDAILSLVHMFRDNTDKLERHEYRERQLGDQLKKTLSSIEKKQKTEEASQVIDTLNAINRRLESIENVISKERSAPIADAAVNFQRSIQDKLSNIEEGIQRNELVMESIRSNSIQKLEAILLNVLQSQSAISTLDQKFLKYLTNESTETINMLEAKLTNIESLQGKLDLISTFHQNANEEVTRIRQYISEYVRKENGTNCQLPNSLIQKLDEVQNMVHEINQNDTGRCHKHQAAEETQRLIDQNYQRILSAISEMTTSSTGESNKNADQKYEELLREFKDLAKMEQVLIQTADNVLDTKRRMEYGTHQILLEIGDMIKVSSKGTNETVNKRFDTISAEILYNTNEALQNLSSKLETEISQVWRQIGIMYQTLTNSADSLDKLQQQTEIYVNGSLSTMDNMEGKVGQITSRMSEVDENLNYLLGRLSLVTQEFNQIKAGLGEALDNIRKSFHTVQDKVKDVGPGPNPIEEEERLSVGTPLLKTKYDTVN